MSELLNRPECKQMMADLYMSGMSVQDIAVAFGKISKARVENSILEIMPDLHYNFFPQVHKNKDLVISVVNVALKAYKATVIQEVYNRAFPISGEKFISVKEVESILTDSTPRFT